MRQISNQYFFSVEGETEKWYFDHLKSLINNDERSKYKVDIICKVNKSPEKFIKALTNPVKAQIFHICDYEADDQEHIFI